MKEKRKTKNLMKRSTGKGEEKENRKEKQNEMKN